jgi:hypothetical protein
MNKLFVVFYKNEKIMDLFFFFIDTFSNELNVNAAQNNRRLEATTSRVRHGYCDDGIVVRLH